MHRQIGLSLADPFLKFCVKFYTPDPDRIEEEYTKYLFCLQIKRDLMLGDLQCNDNTAALIISYIVQGKLFSNSYVSIPFFSYRITKYFTRFSGMRRLFAGRLSRSYVFIVAQVRFLSR